MTLSDFVQKKRVEARQQGFLQAGYTGVQEALGKSLTAVADYRATPIWEAEWDVCLVLDACRFDLWQEVAPVYDYPTTSKWSVGSASVEWINSTFADQYEQEWRQTGYVTGNPHTAKTADFGNFTDGSVYPLKDRGLPYLDEVWADQWHIDDYETVRPEIMTERGLYAWNHRERYNMDSLLVHYMQPHIPFKNHTEWTAGWDNALAFGVAAEERGKKGDWQKLRDGEIPHDEFWNAYATNLEWVLHEVQRWQEHVDGTILVTSDHGNAMGEWGMWGHPPGNACPELRKVPWVTIEGHGNQTADTTVPGNPPVIAEESESVESRLEALGYK